MQIGTLAVSGSNPTIINRDQVDAYILIGTVDEDVPLTAFSITIGGKVTQSLSTTAHIQAYAKYLQESLLGADVKVGMLLKVAGDFIPGQNIQYSFDSDDAAVTFPIYAFSEGETDQIPVVAGQVTKQDGDNQIFEGSEFTALIFPDTNLDYVNVEYVDGHTSKMTGAEIDALFSLYNNADADGRLAAMHVLDNSRGDIARATVFASGGTLKITTAKLV